MGRELRMVPKDWEHPTEERWDHRQGKYTKQLVPLYYNYAAALAEFEERIKSHGLRDALDYFGGGPVTDDYMLVDVPESELTHFMMYEDTTEGTPISPAFETPEELARWLANNGASSFGSSTASYDAWLATIKRGWTVSAIMAPGVGIVDGVTAEYELDKRGG